MSAPAVTVVVDFPTGPETRHLRADSGIAAGSTLRLDEYRRVRGLESVRNQRDRERGANPAAPAGRRSRLRTALARLFDWSWA